MRLELHGADELVRRLRGAEAKVAAKELRKVLANSMKEVARRVRLAAPFDPEDDPIPHLRKSVRRRSRIGSGASSKIAEARVAIGTKKQKGVILKGFAQEYGTVRHDDQAFLVPTFEASRDDILEDIKTEVERVFS